MLKKYCGRTTTDINLLFNLACLASEKSQLNRLILPEFSLEIPACRMSQENLRRNYDVVEKLIDKPRSKPLEEYIDILLTKCEFVIVELSKLSEAFQFLIHRTREDWIFIHMIC